MESIATFDAKTRLSELLDRAANGETFEITKNGRPVGSWVLRTPRVTPRSSRRPSSGSSTIAARSRV